jgi:Derlin-2/3
MELNPNAPFSAMFIVCSVSVALLIYVHSINFFDIYYNRDKIFKEHQYWRLFSSLVYFGDMGLEAFIQLSALIQYMGGSESLYFARRPADFLLFVFFGVAVLWVYAYFCPIMFLGPGLCSYFLYYTAKRAPDNRWMLFILPIPVRAPYVPIMLLGLHWRSRGREFWTALVGYVAAHVYFYIRDVLSSRFEKNLFSAPAAVNNFLNRILGAFLNT